MKLLSDDEKQQLKAQCGGMRTLLRNHHQIFKVIDDSVRLKNWTLEKERKGHNPVVLKKSCWFFFNHPDGCPAAECCTFSHAV